MYKITDYKLYLINLLISLTPLCLIIGNTAININITIICLLGLWIYKSDIFFIKSKVYQYLIYVFFSYLIIITIINNLNFFAENELYKIHLIKSFFFLRFLLIFLIITKLIENNNLNIRKFFIFSSIFSLIVVLDVLFQYLTGKNVIGYPLFEGIRATSFFGEELITGGYLQKFTLFLIFYTTIINKNKKYSDLIILILFLVCLISIILTFNRMPLFLYLMSIVLYFLIERKIKQIIIILVFFVSAILLMVNFNFSSSKKTNADIQIKIDADLKNFYFEAKDIITNFSGLLLNNQLENENIWRKSGYVIHFNSGIQIWKENKIFGNGFKSFRLKCRYVKNQTCNTHPHNYFIEILVDTGLIGITLIYLIFILGIIKFLKYYFKEKKLNSRLTSIVFFIIVFFELFPFRSTGSFFTTSVAYVFFIMLPIFLNVKKLQKL